VEKLNSHFFDVLVIRKNLGIWTAAQSAAKGFHRALLGEIILPSFIC
jgi:hypothetical protein